MQYLKTNLQATLKDFFSLGASDCAVDGDLFVSPDAERSDSVPSLGENGLLTSQLFQHLGGTEEIQNETKFRVYRGKTHRVSLSPLSPTQMLRHNLRILTSRITFLLLSFFSGLGLRTRIFLGPAATLGGATFFALAAPALSCEPVEMVQMKINVLWTQFEILITGAWRINLTNILCAVSAEIEQNSLYREHVNTQHSRVNKESCCVMWY